MTPTFIQIHGLTSYPGALLNRDDAGFAKRLPFGGVTRTRISSQCLKRHWRTFKGAHSLAEMEVPMSVRSRLAFSRIVAAELYQGGNDALVNLAAGELMDAILGKSKKRAAKEADPDKLLMSDQLTVLGYPELRWVQDQVRTLIADTTDEKVVKKRIEEFLKGDMKKNLAALKHGAGLDAALFGRMVTSDVLARGDAAIHVAHAFTVHAEASESDYFSAVDDLLSNGDDSELGAAHINSVELTSGLYYTYVVIDVPLLVSNLEGCRRDAWKEADRTLAGEVIERFVHLIATVSPGAKLGSTAPYSYAHSLLLEAGVAQPRTLANAFLKPVHPRPDLAHNAVAAMLHHVADFDAMYGFDGSVEQRSWSLLPSLSEGLEHQRIHVDGFKPIPEIAGWANARVRGDHA